MTPIALFAYNRPEHLRQTLQALERADGFVDCPLFIYCDGPKGDDPGVSAVRAIAREYGEVIERPANWGFGNLTRGVSELCERFGRAIVLEDDLLVAPDFLTYMCAALERYEHESDVWVVNGYMFPDAQTPEPETFFLPTALPWGWATWHRAWRHFEWRPRGWEQLKKNRRLRKGFDFDGQWRISRWVIDCMEGRLAAWDPQWAYKVYTSQALGLFPSRPLVWNTGLLSGVHGEIHQPEAAKLQPTFFGRDTAESFTRPQLPSNWSFPPEIAPSAPAYTSLANFFQRERKRKD